MLCDSNYSFCLAVLNVIYYIGFSKYIKIFLWPTDKTCVILFYMLLSDVLFCQYELDKLVWG